MIIFCYAHLIYNIINL